MPNRRTDNNRADAQMGDLSPTRILRKVRETVPPPQPQRDERR